MKEQDKTPEKQLNEVEISNLPEKEFRIMIVKMIQDLGKRTEAKIKKTQEMLNKDLEELKNKQTEMNNTITEMKNTLEGFPGGAVVESPPADAGDTGSCPSPGRSHVPWSGWAHEPWPLSLRIWSLFSTTGEVTTVRGLRTAKINK